MLKKSARSKFRPEYPIEFQFDYKDPVTLFRFVMDGGKITPSRISKVSLKQQRNVSNKIKTARDLALLPVGTDAADTFGRPEQISAKPFEF